MVGEENCISNLVVSFPSLLSAVSGSIHTVLEGDSPATCCTFDYVGKLLAVGTFMGSTVLYNLETRELLCELCNNASSVRSVMFSNDTERLTTVCNRQAIVWDVASTSKVCGGH